jgi:anti-sigma factor RsiW
MNMRITDEQLCAYLDDELDPAMRVRVEQALAEDPHLEAKLAGWTSQSARLNNALQPELHEPLPEAWLETAREPVAAKIPSVRPAEPAARWIRQLMPWMPTPRFVVGMSFAVMLGIVVGRDVIPRLDMDEQLVRLAAVAHHVYSPDKRQPVEVRSDDPTLTAWISKRLGANVVAPTISGYRFLGGRLLAGAEEPAGQFMYEQASGDRVTVFMRTEGAAGRSTTPRCDAYRAVSVCYWHAGQVAYALAGEIPQADLLALAQSSAGSVKSAKP